MDRRDRVEPISETRRKTRQHARVKGRPHHEANHPKIQEQHGSLANTMCHETLGPSQVRAEDQSNTHCDLNRKIQIRAVTTMSTEKTLHNAHFLTCAEQRRRNSHPQRL